MPDLTLDQVINAISQQNAEIQKLRDAPGKTAMQQTQRFNRLLEVGEEQEPLLKRLAKLTGSSAKDIPKATKAFLKRPGGLGGLGVGLLQMLAQQGVLSQFKKPEEQAQMQQVFESGGLSLPQRQPLPFFRR